MLHSDLQVYLLPPPPPAPPPAPPAPAPAPAAPPPILPPPLQVFADWHYEEEQLGAAKRAAAEGVDTS